jgi:hypothetical protein
MEKSFAARVEAWHRAHVTLLNIADFHERLGRSVTPEADDEFMRRFAQVEWHEALALLAEPVQTPADFLLKIGIWEACSNVRAALEEDEDPFVFPLVSAIVGDAKVIAAAASNSHTVRA